jgi:hypothetical protein
MGRLVRSRQNHGRCRFPSGKEYDCDLNAAGNIAARWFAARARRKASRATTPPSPAGRKPRWSAPGQRSGARQRPSGTEPGMPVTLSSLWLTPQALAA